MLELASRVSRFCALRLWRGAMTAAAIGLAVPGMAQETVTLAQAEQRMADNELELQVLDLEQDVAAEVVRQALGERLPRVRLQISYIQTQQEIVSQDNETFEEGTSSYPTTTATLSVTQPIYDAERFRALPLARAEEALVEAEAAAARNEISRRLVDSFLQVARRQIDIERTRAIVRVRTQYQRELGLLVDAGRADADAELRAESDVFAARARVSEAELDLADALFELRRFTGAGVEGVVFRPGVGVADLAQFRQTFAPERLDALNPRIQVARAELDVAQRALEQVRGAFQPTANLTLEYSDEETEGSLFGGGSNVRSGEAGIELAWSIYEGGVRRSRVREAERRVEIAELRLRQQRDRAERRYTSLTSALERSLEAAAAAAQDARVAAERYEAALAQQDAGRIGFERVLETRLRRDTTRLQARLARLRSVRLQSDLYALFGALDIGTLSEDFSNT